MARTRERVAALGLWLAPGSGHLVAAAGAFRLPGDPGTARLQEVDVLPGSRGRGNGDALFEALRRVLVAEGVTRLVVAADEDDWPLSWYRRRASSSRGVGSGAALQVRAVRADPPCTDDRRDP
ncbi:GNAT family N-acetyltransferase [Geodermatophilus sp. URMC 62]|uniref:GNAT family N-acetyltransferase n=1 Tax=Geodermatophilus sp. URMC 62 TaxID=3423414 RepID=UPI00406C70F8